MGKKLEEKIKQLEKLYGKSAVFRYGKDITDRTVKSISTGSLKLDLATGISGVPKGRMVEIFGAESSGKTTLALHIIAEAQKKGELAAFIDAEHALDINYAKNIGVNIDELIISQPDYGEQALQIILNIIESGEIGVVVVDSVAAMTPRAELEGEFEDSQIGAQARLITKGMRKLVSAVSRTDTCLIFVNQLRVKIGVFFGNPEDTPGGKALKFFSSMRLNIKRIGSVKDGKDDIGNKTKVVVVKNKMSSPFKQTEFVIRWGVGIDRIDEMISMGLDYDILTQKGSWFYYKDKRLAQGRESLRGKIVKSSKLQNIIIKKLTGR
jgi:recombination protein RecA